MICSKCNYKNPTQAWYCYKCGNQFTEKEREEASNKGLVGLIKKLRKIYDVLTLSKITSNKYFRILSIAIVLGIGIWGIIINGSNLKINESDNYTYQYNEELNEYYLYTKDNETKVNLYKIGDANTADVFYYDENDNLISNDKYNVDDIVLNANIIKDCYYILKIDNENIKVHVYKEAVK